MSLKLDYYKNVLLSIHRGIAFGKPSNAKPLFLLAIINALEKGLIIGNKISYCSVLEEEYRIVCEFYEPHIKAAPLFKPFFHSTREGYYNIKWRINRFPEHKWHTPSVKFIKDNMEYAYLDDEFWEILQDDLNRKEIKQLLINHYLID